MTPRRVVISALAAVMVLPAAEPLPPWVGRVQAQEILRPARLAQLRRPDDPSGDPTEPGGLPGRSDRSQDSRSMKPRGIIKREKKAAPDKDKGKLEDRTKKDQR